MREVKVRLSEFEIEPQEIHVRINEPVRFVVQNVGLMDHQFKVEGLPGFEGVDHVTPGESKSVEYTFLHPGTYTTVCHYPGHEELGMKGRLVVEI